MKQKFYLVFGDYFRDGHGCYKQIMVHAENQEDILMAEAKVAEKYPEIFRQMADAYCDSSFGPMVWQALRDTEYPAHRFAICDDNSDWNDVYTIDQLLEINSNPQFSIDAIIDVYIWLLNAYGANIEYIPEEIPILWQLKSPGYGCWE